MPAVDRGPAVDEQRVRKVVNERGMGRGWCPREAPTSSRAVQFRGAPTLKERPADGLPGANARGSHTGLYVMPGDKIQPASTTAAEQTAELLPHHLAELRASGLSDETIRAAGIYSESHDILLGVLIGWRHFPKRSLPAIVFPFSARKGTTDTVASNPTSRSSLAANCASTFRRGSVRMKFTCRRPLRMYSIEQTCNC